MKGYVKAVVLDRGFGFIRADRSEDLFFHCRDLTDDLAFDETLIELHVEFEPTTGPDGRPRAREVRRAEP